MPRVGTGEAAEAGPSRPRAGGADGAGAGAKTKRSDQDGVRRKKKRPTTAPAVNGTSTQTLQNTLLSSQPDSHTPSRSRDRAANINPALRPYLATAPKPVSSLSRSALDEAAPLRQAPRENAVGVGVNNKAAGGNGCATTGLGTGLILPSTFLRSRSSLNLSINEGSGVGASGSGGVGAAGGRGGAAGEGDVALPPIQPAPARMYAAGLVAPPLIVPAGSSAAMRQAQAQALAQGRNSLAVPQQSSTPDRAVPARRRDRERNSNRAERNAASGSGRRRSSEDLRVRQHPNMSSTSLTLLPGSSTLVRIPENDTADAQDQNQAQAANSGRRRRRADEQLRRRPTVTSREEGRALGLSRGASMRRVNVWDEVSAVDEQDMPEAPPPFPFPPASGASPTARTGPGAGPTAGGDARMVGAGRGIEGDPANAAPPAFVAGSGPGPAGAPQVPSSPPPTFQQAMGLEPLPHSGDTLLGLPAGSVRRRSSIRALAEADRSNLTTRSSSPAPTVYASAPSSPVASDNEAEEASDSNSSTPGVGTHVGPERIAWDEDIALGYPLEERVRREISRRRRRGEHEDAPIARENEVEPSIEDTEVVSNPGSFPGEHDGSQDGVTSRDPRTDSTAVGAEERRNSAAGVTTRRPSALETAPVSDQPDEIIGGPDRSFSLLTEPSSSPADQTAPAAQEQHGHDSRGSTVARSRPVEGDMSIQGIRPHIDDQRVNVVTVTAPSAEATESRSTPQLASPVDTPREMTDANEADDTVTTQPSRKLTRGKAIRRSSSGYGSLSTPGGSAPISPKFEQESQLGGDPRVGFTFRRRSQQSTGSTTPGIPLESPAQQVQSSSPRQPLFGETGFDWRPASVHLAHDALPEADESDGGVLGARNEAGRASAPILLGLSTQAKNARPAQRASIDFVAAGPGRRVGDTSAPVPPPLIQRTSEGSSTSTAGKGQGKHPAAAVLPSGSRFHEMPRRSTEGDILPHRQAAMKRRELYTASIVPADEVSTAVDPGPSRLPAASPTSPSRPRLADPLPSGPLVDFSDYVVDLAPENESFNAKGKARADSVSSAASTGIGSHRSRPLMPLPPELVALFHEDIVEEQDEDENEDGDGDEAEEEEVGSDGVRANGQEGTSQESLQTAVIEPEIDRQTIRSGRSGTSSRGTITPMASREPIDGVESRARPPSLVIDTDKTLPSLPVLPESPSLQAAGTANAVDDADTGRRRAPPPPPALKRHLVSTTVGANLAPRRSIIRTADTPVTPRPIRQLGSGAVAPPLPTRRPPPPPPRPVSQTLQEALQGSASTQVQPVQRMPPHIGQIDTSGTEGNALPAYFGPHPEPYSSPRLDLSDGPTSRSGASATEVPETPAPAPSALSGPLPPPLPPRPLVLRPTYARNDSVVSSNTSSSSDPTTLSPIPPVPTYKPPPTVRPRGPRPKPPPIPARPWIQVVTNDVTLAEAPAEASIDHGARPPAERTQSDNSVRTVPVRSLDSPSSASTVRAPTRRSTSEMDMRGAAATPADALRSPRSPRSPRVPVARQQSVEYTDLDLLVSRLEGSGREYEGFTQISAFLGPGKTPAASANAISTLLPGLISVDSRRVTKDGKVKLKLSLLGVRVAKCPICLAQFKKDERGVILPECGHHAHETCARKWFKEDGRCFVCREPLVEEQTQQQNNVRSRSGGSSRMVEGVV